MRRPLRSFTQGWRGLTRVVGLLLVMCTANVAIAALPEPSDASKLSRLALQFEEPLIPAGPTSADEDQDLVSAIEAYRAQAEVDDLGPLQAFLSSHPQSEWRLALLTNIGLLDYHYGYFSRALAAFEQAWAQGHDATELPAKALADRAAGELLRMHARLGHVERLATLLEDGRLQTLTGGATEMRDGAREGLWLMRNQPAAAFFCGPMALENLLRASGAPKSTLSLVEQYQPEGRGTTLAEVGRLADRAGMSHRLIYRAPDATVPVPSIIHWKVNHFAAIVGERGSRFLIDDPTFGRSLWVTRAALDAEASGYFLVPASEARNANWRDVGAEEAARVRGMGTTTASDASRTTPGDQNACGGCDSSGGMTAYNFKEMLVSLNLTDKPVGYAPPKGPPVFAELVYNQREANQPATFSFFNVSPKWTLNWLSYIQDDPTLAGANVTRFVSGGGYIDETNYNASTSAFTPEVRDASVLRLTSNGYVRGLKDGGYEVYGLSNGASSFPRLIFRTKVIDPDGNALTFHYDSQLRLTSVVDATGRTSKLAYNSAANPLLVTAITDPFGRSAHLAYDGAGRLSGITDVLGLTSKFSYDSSSLVNSLATPYGTTSFVYGMGADGNSRYLQATDPLGQTERLEYIQGASGIAYSDPAAVVPTGMPQSLFNAYLSSRDTFYWDKHAYQVGAGNYLKARQRHWAHLNSDINITSGMIESVKYPLENRIWYTYPGQQTNSIGAGQSGSLEQPTGMGRVLDDGTTQLTQYAYNSLGNVINRIDPVNRRTLFTYAANAIDVVAVKQGSGSNVPTVASYTYNSHHRPLTYTDAAGQTTSYAYNAAGQVTSMTDALGHVTTYQYDGLGYLTSIINADSQTALTLAYDTYGRVASRTDSQGWMVAFSHDAFDRLTQETYPDGTSRTFTYNKLDLASVQDRQGRTTTYTHDAARQLIAVTDPLGNVTRFGRYENGVLKSLTDPLGHVTGWTIDIESRVLSKQYPDGHLTGYGYEAATSRLLFVGDQLNQIKQNVYTRDDRLAAIRYMNAVNPTPNVSFTYDPNFPRVVSMTDGNGTTTYQYQAVGTLGALKLAQETPPFANTATAYTYDALGRVVSMTVGGNAETFAYDAIGRLVTHVDDLGTFTRAYLGETGQLTRQSNGIVGTTWSYAANANDRRLTGIANGAAGTSFGFTTTPENDITGITESFNQQASTYSYGYDAADRLVSATPSAGKGYAYGYDAADNLASIGRPSGTTTVASTSANEIASVNGAAFSYDANGNLLSDATRTYTWDADNRMVSIGYKAKPGSSTTFRYDGLGRRIAIVSNGIETRYLWCGETLCQARSSSDTVTKRYFREGEENTTAKLYYGVDQLGSVHDALVATSGTSAAHFDYEPYGALTATGQAATTDFRYAGLFYEQQSGLYLANYRAYDSQTGRWVTRDPIGGSGGANLYRYGKGNPAGFVDPFGLSCSPWDQFLSAVQANPWLLATILATEVAGLGPEDPLADAAVVAEIEAAEGGAATVDGIEAAELASDSGASSSLQASRLNIQLSAEEAAGAQAPTSITSYSDHALEQITGRDGGIGVNQSAIDDAFANPNSIQYAPSKYGPTFRYVGNDATVVVNPEGNVVTNWGTSSQGVGR